MNKLFGFTYIEILVTLFLVGLLSSAIFPLGKLIVQYQKEKELKFSLSEIRQAIDAYKYASDHAEIDSTYITRSGYPPNLNALLGVPSSNRDEGDKRFLRRIPSDPFNPNVKNPWGLRSYSSEYNNTKYDNKDIYDIYSKSKLVGSNNLEYSDW